MTESGVQAAQDEWAPSSICFGCGPANEQGLRIKSHWEGDVFIARFTPEPHHQAFPGVLSGGIIGTLLDCHSNWCASTTLKREKKLERAPETVTAEYSVKLRRPCPADVELILRARPTDIDTERDRVVVDAEIEANGKTQATCRGVFVAVKEGHPAYHRWQ